MDFGRRGKGVADPPDSDVSEIRGGRVINYQDIDEAVSTAWHITDGLDDTGVQSVPVTESPNIKTTGPGPHHLTEISEINEKDSRTGRITDSSDLPRAGKSFGAEQKRRINWRNSIPKSKSFKSNGDRVLLHILKQGHHKTKERPHFSKQGPSRIVQLNVSR